MGVGLLREGLLHFGSVLRLQCSDRWRQQWDGQRRQDFAVRGGRGSGNVEEACVSAGLEWRYPRDWIWPLQLLSCLAFPPNPSSFDLHLISPAPLLKTNQNYLLQKSNSLYLYLFTSLFKIVKKYKIHANLQYFGLDTENWYMHLGFMPVFHVEHPASWCKKTLKDKSTSRIKIFIISW